MSDRMWAKIQVWGDLPQDKLEAFCIWSELDEAQLGEASGQGACVEVEEEEQPWGEFSEIEAACREFGLGYLRLTDAKYEYDAEMVWRLPGPDRDVEERYRAMSGSEPLIPASEILEALGELGEAGPEAVLQCIRKMAALPPLPGVFRIVPEHEERKES